MTHTFTKTPDPESVDHTEVRFTSRDDELDALVATFEDYLRGCGYCFDGRVAIVDDEEIA